MKKEINFNDYYKYLDPELKKEIDSELSTCELEPNEMVIKRVSGNTIEEVEADSYESTGYASMRTLDFSGDIVIPEGINLSIFKKNPIIFYQHLQSRPPIGKATKLRRDEMGLKVTVKYAVEEYAEAETIYKLVKGGYIKQHSIGFLPLEALRKGQSGFEELNKVLKKKYKEYKGDAERIITKSLLLEVSVVNIADNQDSTISDVKSLNTEDYDILKKYGINTEETTADNMAEVTVELPEEIEVVEEFVEVKEIDTSIELVIDRTIEEVKEINKEITPIYTKKQIQEIKEMTRKGQLVRL